MQSASTLSRAVPLVAGMLCRSYGVKVAFGGDGAHTDGEHIQLPGLIESPVPEDVLYGYLTHEAGHVRFTDFTTLRDVRSRLEHNVFNVLEDGRIEKRMCLEYPGAIYYISAVLRHVDAREPAENVFVFGKDDVSADAGPVELLLNYLFVYARARMSGVEFYRPREPRARALVEAKFGPEFTSGLDDILGRAEKAKSSNDALRAAKAVIELLGKTAQKQPQNSGGADSKSSRKPSNSSQSENGAANQEKGGADQNSGGSEESGNSRGGASQNGSQGSSEEQNAQGAPDDQTSGSGEPRFSGGDAAQQKGADGSQTPGASSGAQASQASNGDDGCEADPSEAAKEVLATPYSRLTQLSDSNPSRQIAGELEAHADRSLGLDGVDPVELLGLSGSAGGGLGGGESLTTARDADPTIMSKVDQVVPTLRRRLQVELEANARALKRQTPNGGRLTLRGLQRHIQGDPRIFTRKGPVKAVNTAVHIVLDLSGSMAGPKETASKVAALSLMRALLGVRDVSFGLTTFQTTGRRNSPLIQPMLIQGRNRSAVAVRQAEAKLTNTPSEGNTPIAEALLASSLALAADRKAERRILFIITDDQIPKLDRLHEQLAKGGVETRCVLFGQPKRCSSFDVLRCISPTCSVEEITQAIVEMVSEDVRLA